MKNIFEEWARIDNGISHIDGVVEVDDRCDEYINQTLFHCTNNVNIETLKVSDIFMLKSNKSFLGEGVYWSTRPEKIYGETTIQINGIVGKNVKTVEDYSWFTSETVNLKIVNIDRSSKILTVELA